VISTIATLQDTKTTGLKPFKSQIQFSSVITILPSQVLSMPPSSKLLLFRLIFMQLAMFPALSKVEDNLLNYFLRKYQRKWKKKDWEPRGWIAHSTVRKMPGVFNPQRKAKVAIKDPNLVPTLQEFSNIIRRSHYLVNNKRKLPLKISTKALFIIWKIFQDTRRIPTWESFIVNSRSTKSKRKAVLMMNIQSDQILLWGCRRQ